jgi:hypothetical protein
VNIFESIRAHLAATAGISVIVGTRVYHGERPQNSDLPAVAFDESGDAESFQDISGNLAGIARIGISIECYAAGPSPTAAVTLREAVRDALQSWPKSPMGGAGGTEVWCCDFAGQSGAYDPETLTIIREISFELMYTET